MNRIFLPDTDQKPVKHNEGDLYGVFTIHGRTFELYYGYYEDGDRYSKYCEPIEIYPDFRKTPVYTDEGIPFVTAMQFACEYYEKKRDIADTCADCVYFQNCEELFGICKCPHNRKTNQL